MIADDLIYESHCGLTRDRKFDVKGESIDEERNQESCEGPGEEEGRSEEGQEVVSSSGRPLGGSKYKVSTEAPRDRGLFSRLLARGPEPVRAHDRSHLILPLRIHVEESADTL